MKGYHVKKRSRQRDPIYGVVAADIVMVIARSLDYPCAERLKPVLGWVAKHLMKHNELYVEEETLKKLEAISI